MFSQFVKNSLSGSSSWKSLIQSSSSKKIIFNSNANQKKNLLLTTSSSANHQTKLNTIQTLNSMEFDSVRSLHTSSNLEMPFVGFKNKGTKLIKRGKRKQPMTVWRPKDFTARGAHYGIVQPGEFDEWEAQQAEIMKRDEQLKQEQAAAFQSQKQQKAGQTKQQKASSTTLNTTSNSTTSSSSTTTTTSTTEVPQAPEDTSMKELEQRLKQLEQSLNSSKKPRQQQRPPMRK